MPNLLLLACLAATLYMTGLIWLVQVVHYPLMAQVGPDAFPAYHAAHSRLITPIVFFPMLVELVTAMALLAVRPRGAPGWAVWLGAALVGVVWLATAIVQVPLHGRLGSGAPQAETVAALVASNWVRTIAWTARSALMLWLAWLAMGAE